VQKKEEKAKYIIGVGLPIAEIVHPKVYYNHLAAVAEWKSRFQLHIIGIEGMKITRARNEIAAVAISRGCTHLLFIDSDHILPPRMLSMLMENQDAAMVSGLIHKRLYPYEQVAFVDNGKGKLEMALLKDNTVMEVDACAMGCTLINLKQLQMLGRPYFSDGYFRHDINLCLKFKRELGGRILVDSRIHIGHVGGEEIVYPENVEFLRKMHDGIVVPVTSVRPERVKDE